jgi:hypothetical protein
MTQANNINPRDWFNTRRINFMPQHFTRVSLETIDVFSHDEAAHWIDTNGEGRYCVVNVAQRQGEHIVQKTYAGFEDPLEASYFSLAYLATQSKRSTPF